MSAWMQTYTGKQFFPLDPRAEDIDARDIAHALSQICRYGGHTSHHYSVAEHCLLLSRAVAPENALWALLHDAAEAYIGDMIRPLKVLAMAETFREADRVLTRMILNKFGGPGAYGLGMPLEVAEADTRICLNERAALMATPPASWALNVEPLPDVVPKGWDPWRAEYEWLIRLEELRTDENQGT